MNNYLYEAFGERKSLCAWARDPRCPVSVSALYYRVKFKGMTIEQALGYADFVPPVWLNSGRKLKTITAWGETKTLAEWVADPRSNVTLTRLYIRLKKGLPPEIAISQPTRGRTPGKYRCSITAWGETKTAIEWAADRRANVTMEAIVNRISRGWSPEDAISRRYKRRP